VKLRKPRDVEHFNEKTHELKQHLQTNSHLMFDKVRDIVEKNEQFAREQASKVDQLIRGND
jgi:hypothetical protein